MVILKYGFCNSYSVRRIIFLCLQHPTCELDPSQSEELITWSASWTNASKHCTVLLLFCQCTCTVAFAPASSRQCLLVCCIACSEIEIASEQQSRQYLVF